MKYIVKPTGSDTIQVDACSFNITTDGFLYFTSGTTIVACVKSFEWFMFVNSEDVEKSEHDYQKENKWLLDRVKKLQNDGPRVVPAKENCKDFQLACFYERKL